MILSHPGLPEDVVKDVRVSCNSEDMTLTISTLVDSFNGMIYPKGLSKNSSCMTEYIRQEKDLIYILPLRSCNTMSTDLVRLKDNRDHSCTCALVFSSSADKRGGVLQHGGGATPLEAGDQPGQRLSHQMPLQD